MDNYITRRMEEGAILMESAACKYRRGDYRGAEADRSKANAILNESYSAVNSESGELSMLYGDNRNFGIMYKVFEENAKKLYESQTNTEDVGTMLRYIRENKVLKAQFDVYNSLVYPVNVVNEEKFVDSVVELAERYPASVVRENNEKFIRLMRICGLDEMVEISDDDLKLYEAVEYVATNRPSMNNINRYNEVKSFLAESVRKNNRNVEGVDIDELYESRTRELEEKYDGILNDDEKAFIAEMSDPDTDRRNAFEEAKNEALESVRRQIAEDSENAEQWTAIMERISGKQYDEDTAMVDIAEMIDVKNTFEA